MPPYIPRRNEYERLVAFLTDQRFFLPVALTSSLAGGHGFGKTTLARAVCQDARVISEFSDGIYWVTLGRGLTNLGIFSRIERLIFELTGEHSAFNTLEEAEERLHDSLHPRRTLLVIDEVENEGSLRSFLKSGPGGACLLIGADDASLPITARRVPVDIMMPSEAAALLMSGLLPETLLPEPPLSEPPLQEPPLSEPRLSKPPLPAGEAAQVELNEPPVPDEPQDFPDLASLLSSNTAVEGGLLANPEMLAAMERMAPDPNLARPSVPAIPAELREAVTALADRLNDWPLLLGMVNGLLRGEQTGEEHHPADLAGALASVSARLEAQGLTAGWPIDDPAARRRAAAAVLAICLEPFSPGERERFLDLVVFDPEEEIAFGAVEVLWQLSQLETRLLLERLSRRGLEIVHAGQSIRLNTGMHTCLQEQMLAGKLTELHNRMVDGYDLRCPKGRASGPDDGYYFQHQAMHLEMAGRRAELQALLFDFDWLAHFLNCAQLPGGRSGDFYALLADYERALSSSLDQQSAQLRLVQDALQMSGRVLTRDLTQLAPQLLGRLLPFDEPEIREMIHQARDGQGRAWLRPLAGCFTPPGGDELRVLPGHDDWVTAVAILPDGQRAISGSLDGTLRIWDLGNGQTLRIIQAHEGGVSALKLTPDGLRAVSAGWDGLVRVWNLADGREERAIVAHFEPVGALVITPDGKYAVTGADDSLIRVWNLDSGLKEKELVGHTDLVRVLAITPDGRTLVSGSWDYTLRIWDLDTGSVMHTLTGHEGWVRSLAVSPDGAYALSGAWDRTVRVWDLWTGEMVRMAADFSAPVYSLVVSADNRLLLTGGGDGSVRMWDFETMQEQRVVSGHTGGVNDMVFTQGGRFMLSGSDDRTLRVWDLASVAGSELRTGHDGPVFALAALPDGKHTLTGSLDGTLKVWEPAAGKEIRTLTGHEGGVISLAVTADGRLAISGSQDCTVRLWDLAGASEIRSLSGHEQPVTAVAISTDGHTAVSGDSGGVVRAWDARTGSCVAEFRGEGAIWACALSADGRVIAAAEGSGKMYFLEIER